MAIFRKRNISQAFCVGILASTLLCLPSIGTAATWTTPQGKSLLVRCLELFLGPGKISPEQALLHAASFGFGQPPPFVYKQLENNVAGAFGLSFAVDENGDYVRANVLGSSNIVVVDADYEINYYPLFSAYFVPKATIDLMAIILDSDRISSEFSQAKNLIDVLLEMLAQDGGKGSTHREIIVNRLQELKKKPTIKIGGMEFVGIAPQKDTRPEKKNEPDAPVRFAATSDWVDAPPTMFDESFPGRVILSGRVEKFGSWLKYRDILQPPAFGGPAEDAIGVPVEGQPAVIMSGTKAVIGIYRGYWGPSPIRGWPLTFELNIYSVETYNQSAQRFHFLEILDTQGQKEIIAIPVVAGLRMFSTAFPCGYR